MKQIKNAIFAIVGGLLMVTVATVSCKKDDPAGPLSTLTSFAPTTAAAGETVTITGTNLTGTTAVSFGGTAATSFVVVNATTITAVVGAGATGVVALTTPGGNVSLPGFTFLAPGSDDIAPDFLVAHWTFDNTKAEVKSGLSPNTTGTTSYTPGLIGGATGALAFNGANLVYPTIDTLNKPTTFAGGFTLTMWAKIPVQTLYTSLFQINGNIGDIFGLIGLAHRKNPDNVFDFDGAMTNVDGTGTHSTTFSAHLEGAASGFTITDAEWAFIVMSYDSTSKTIKYYGNAALKGSKSIGGIIQPGAQFEMVTTNSNPGVSINQVSFGALNVTPTFPGGVAPGGWQSPNLIAGTVIDDTRLFNKTLSQDEITNLYTYGLAGK